MVTIIVIINISDGFSVLLRSDFPSYKIPALYPHHNPPFTRVRLGGNAWVVIWYRDNLPSPPLL